MNAAHHLRLYLDPPALHRFAQGEHNFFCRLAAAFRSRGWRVDAEESHLGSRLIAPERDGYALFHMEPPTHARALTARRAYIGAFWRVEAQAERWNWPIAKAAFDPDQLDPERAKIFCDQWRNRLYSGVKPVSDDGFTLIALQGILTEKRGFQSMSPVRMIETLLVRSTQPVLATLHPKEVYSAADIAALDDLMRRFSHFRYQSGGSLAALRACSRFATQNSSLALDAYFNGKPVLLFADIEFHHKAASVPRDGLEAALAGWVAADDGDRYLYWFFRHQMINAGAPDTEAQILARCRDHGWPI